MKSLFNATVFLFCSIFLVPGVYSGEWVKIGKDYHYDVSGIVLLKQTNRFDRFLITHDNKYPGEPRCAVVTIESTAKVDYRPLYWPGKSEAPSDFETLSRWPGKPEQSFVMTTSKGKAVHFSISPYDSLLKIHKEFKLPVYKPSKGKKNLEGFQIVILDGKFFAVYGHRGSDSDPGVLYTATFDPVRYTVSDYDTTQIKVPWPDKTEVRHISEIRVNSRGMVYSTAATEFSNDGPFDGAFYHLGQLSVRSGKIHFEKNPNLIPIHRFPNKKLEGFDMVPGSNGGVVFGTDDEHLGAYIWTGWR